MKSESEGRKCVESEARWFPVHASPMTEPPDPSPDAIQRVLFIASSVHVYALPPLTTTKGYHAASWTANNNSREIFVARLRILETAIPHLDGSGETLNTEILLEDPATGQLFAAAPYKDAGAVEPALDSARFFAVRVVGDGGRKAVLGIGFEDRAEAIDFGISLQEARKVQKFGDGREGGKKGRKEEEGGKVHRDLSLKEGETIHIDIGRKARRKEDHSSTKEEDRSVFGIKPPSSPGVQKEDSGTVIPLLPPPPSAQDIKAEKRRSRQGAVPEPGSAADLGFDDGEFGEFQ